MNTLCTYVLQAVNIPPSFHPSLLPSFPPSLLPSLFLSHADGYGHWTNLMVSSPSPSPSPTLPSNFVRWPRRAFRFCLRATQIVRFVQRKLRASLNGNCPNALRSTEIACFAQRKLRASPNALRSTKIACFA